jgi:EAL domain-containing protein (putative c-di-GMP-specific phosphodiesterase class I)
MGNVGAAPLRMLVVDDDPQILRAVGRTLRASGHEVDLATRGGDAIERIGCAPYDVVLSDIAMPGMDGVALLHAIREKDLHVPVVLVTGEPTVNTAVQALELGAFRYLTKPVAPGELEQTVVTAARMYRMAQFKLAASTLLGHSPRLGADRVGLEASFQRALATLWMAYQPIFDVSAGRVYGFEALLRTKEASLRDPLAVLDAAERLSRLDELGQLVRAHTATDLRDSLQGSLLFVNLHVRDLLDDELFDERSPLSRLAENVVLEITERSSLCAVRDVRTRVARLRDLGFRIALDDLGAGYAGLTSFALLEPDYVKLDMDLVRDIHHSRTKQKIIASMARLAKDMGIHVIAEGVGSAAEQDVVVELGCGLVQGYFLGKPARLDDRPLTDPHADPYLLPPALRR